MREDSHCNTHLSYVFKIVVSFLQGSGSVEGFPDAGVFAEESLTVVFYPVHHLNNRREHNNHPLCRPPGLKVAPFFSFLTPFFLPWRYTRKSQVQNGLRTHELRMGQMKPSWSAWENLGHSCCEEQDVEYSAWLDNCLTTKLQQLTSSIQPFLC